MKYTSEIIIDLPREEVIRKFEDPANFKHWQRGFISFEPVQGKLGEPGSKNMLKYKMGKRDIEMIETIKKNNLPHEFHATYDAKGVFNIQENTFEELPEGKTQWISKSEFQFSGFMKAIAFVMPKAFKKQSEQFMEDFKAFAEDEKSVLD